jgi:hypothetical protein
LCIDCAAIVYRLRSDCVSIAQRLCNDCAAFSQRLRGDFATTGKRLRSDCDFATITRRLRNDYAATPQRLREDLETIAKRWRSVTIAQRFRIDCAGISQRSYGDSRYDVAAISRRLRRRIDHNALEVSASALFFRQQSKTPKLCLPRILGALEIPLPGRADRSPLDRLPSTGCELRDLLPPVVGAYSALPHAVTGDRGFVGNVDGLCVGVLLLVGIGVFESGPAADMGRGGVVVRK